MSSYQSLLYIFWSYIVRCISLWSLYTFDLLFILLIYDVPLCFSWLKKKPFYPFFLILIAHESLSYVRSSNIYHAYLKRDTHIGVLSPWASKLPHRECQFPTSRTRLNNNKGYDFYRIYLGTVEGHWGLRRKSHTVLTHNLP